MGLEQLIQNGPTGLVAGYMGGAAAGTDLRSKLATAGQTLAQTDRYTQETPSYLQKSRADARSAELGNLQGEADLAAGVPGAKAQESLMSARQKAQQAEAEFKNWPAKHKLQLMDQMGQQVDKFNQVGLQLLQFSGSTGEAIQQMAQAYPDITKDPQFTQWAKQYGNMPKEQALAAFKFEMQKYASGIATTREKFQAEALQEDQKGQQALEQGAQRGQYGIAEAQVRADTTAAGKKPSADEFLYSQIQAANPGATPAQLAQLFVDAKTLVTKETPSLISPTGIATTTTRKGTQGTTPSSDIKSLVEASGARYEPNKFDYRINPETGKVQKKPKGN